MKTLKLLLKPGSGNTWFSRTSAAVSSPCSHFQISVSKAVSERVSWTESRVGASLTGRTMLHLWLLEKGALHSQGKPGSSRPSRQTPPSSVPFSSLPGRASTAPPQASCHLGTAQLCHHTPSLQNRGSAGTRGTQLSSLCLYSPS